LRLSIIIPCYNLKKPLQEAADSCYAPALSGSTLQGVMVDDSSTKNGMS